MGMSASQARLLSITSRMNDVEMRSQQISNTKIRLADESEQVATDYTTALNKTKLSLSTYDTTTGQQVSVDLKPSNLAEYGYRLVDKNGNDITQLKVQTASTQAASTQAITNVSGGDIKLMNSAAASSLNVNSASKLTKLPAINTSYMNITSAQMYEMIESGEFMLQKINSDGGYEDTSVSKETQIVSKSDDSGFALAEAEYNAKTLKINNKEKKLDNELKAMDTEHSALKTEMDSVKSLIKDNVDKTFNLFS